MNYFNKTVMMLTLTACIATNSIAQDRLDTLIARVNQFGHDLKTFKKCRGTAQGCPADVKQRLTMAAKAIAAGTAVVLAATAGAGITAGVFAYKQGAKWKGTWGEVEPRLREMFGYKYTTDQEDFIRGAYKGKLSFEKMKKEYVPQSEKRAIQAAIFIARQRGHVRIANEIEQLYNFEVSSSKNAPK